MSVPRLLFGITLSAATVWAAGPTTKTTTTQKKQGSNSGQKKGMADVEEVWPAWPTCVLTDKAFRSPSPVFADVRRFINHADSVRHRTITFSSSERLGMGLQEDPHELGEVVEELLPDSQALRAGVRKGWIIKEIDGRPFKPTERLKDVAEDFDKARKVGATLTVKYDVRTYIDCYNATCTKSDRFPADSMESCAEACNSVGGCQWWSFGKVDEDNMCKLQGQSRGFITSVGTNSGARKCLPVPNWAGLSPSWPKCVISNAYIGEAFQVFADVRPFLAPKELRHRAVMFDVNSDVGLVMHEGAHENGELVSDVVDGSQAAKAGVRKGWIITAVNGKSFKKTKGVEDVLADFNKLKGNSATLEVTFDVRTSMDCTKGECAHSDKLPAESDGACAEICSQIPACEWWVFATEQEDSMCFLRSAGKSIEAREGSSAGSKSCVPPRRGKYMLLASAILLGLCIYFRVELLSRLAALPMFRRLVPASGMSWKRGGPTLELGKAADFTLGDEEADERDTLISRHRKLPSTYDLDSAL